MTPQAAFPGRSVGNTKFQRSHNNIHVGTRAVKCTPRGPTLRQRCMAVVHGRAPWAVGSRDGWQCPTSAPSLGARPGRELGRSWGHTPGAEPCGAVVSTSTASESRGHLVNVVSRVTHSSTWDVCHCRGVWPRGPTHCLQHRNLVPVPPGAVVTATGPWSNLPRGTQHLAPMSGARTHSPSPASPSHSPSSWKEKWMSPGRK